MPKQSPAEQLIEQLVEQRAKEHAEAIRRLKAQGARLKKQAEASEKKQLQILNSIGVKKDVFDQDERTGAAELKAFLADARPSLVGREHSRGYDGKYRAELTAHLGDKARVVAPYGGFAPADGGGGITSGWVFTDASPVKIKDSDTGHGSGLGWASAKAFTPFDVVFTFIPALTTNYEMTAVLAFHGFYVLRADDGWFSSKRASVDMRVTMNVHQYVDFSWKSFPYLIDRSEQNVNEFDNFDRTFFFDYTAPLRAGDPVVVTARIEIVAAASGGGSYAELNFADGEANFIQPLLLSVTTV